MKGDRMNDLINKQIEIPNSILEENLSEEQIIENYEELYNKIKVGDIVWAKRYQSEEEKETIPEGHREGPYIVLKKQEGKLICTQGKGVVPYEDFYDVTFYLNNEGYNLSKETFFYLHKLYSIDEFSLLNMADKLNQTDLDRLYKKIKLAGRFYYSDDSKMIKFNFPIQTGDIIEKDNKNFIIIDIENNKLSCLLLNDKNNFDNLDYSKLSYLDKSENLKYISTVNNKTLNYILKNWKSYIYRANNIHKTQRGSIIFMNNKYYYIYGEESQDWYVFELIKNKISNGEKIRINNKIYYTKYEDLKINKKMQFDNYYICTEEEMDEIKITRKNYKETKKREEIYGTSETLYFKVGDIIENINYRNKRYIIIDIHKKTYECVSIDNLINGIYYPVLIRKKEAKISSDFSIKGIIWLEENSNFNLEEIMKEGVLEQIIAMQEQFIGNKEQNKRMLRVGLEPSCDGIVDEYIEITKNSIVKTSVFSDESFRVKDILGDLLVCESAVEHNRKYYFKKNDVIVVKNKQKRK